MPFPVQNVGAKFVSFVRKPQHERYLSSFIGLIRFTGQDRGAVMNTTFVEEGSSL